MVLISTDKLADMEMGRRPRPIGGNANKDSRNDNSNTLEAQRNRILDHLQQFGSFTTLYARHHLDVLHPAARIHELRHREGYSIETVWDTETNPGGGRHRIARYFLRSDG